MCIVSNVIDDFNRRWPSPTPGVYPSTPGIYPYPNTTGQGGGTTVIQTPPQLTKEELEALRDLLKAAQKYDDATGQPDCESDDKIAQLKSTLIRYLAELDDSENEIDPLEVGLDLIYEIADILGIDLAELNSYD